MIIEKALNYTCLISIKYEGTMNYSTHEVNMNAADRLVNKAPVNKIPILDLKWWIYIPQIFTCLDDILTGCPPWNLSWSTVVTHVWGYIDYLGGWSCHCTRISIILVRNTWRNYQKAHTLNYKVFIIWSMDVSTGGEKS